MERILMYCLSKFFLTTLKFLSVLSITFTKEPSPKAWLYFGDGVGPGFVTRRVNRGSKDTFVKRRFGYHFNDVLAV